MAEPGVWAAIKPVAPVLEVEWLTGTVHVDGRHLVRTQADAAACATARALAAHLGTTYAVVAVAQAAATAVLLDAVAEGAARAVRVEVGEGEDDTGGPQWPSDVVAGALARVVGGARVVVCGDASGDRGSSTVPGLLAGALGVAQALSLRTVAVDGGRLVATRRTDGGRREHLAVDAPCVLSVEASAASPSRAPLAEVVAVASGERAVEVRHLAAPRGARRGEPEGAALAPYRPRPSDVAAPRERDPVRRAIEVAGSRTARDTRELLRCEPEEAADAILEHLERWGLR